MNQTARELNDILEPTIAARLLSDMGRRFYFPRGIVAQSGEAKEFAHRFNATAGMAFAAGQPMILPSIQSCAPLLSPEELVSYSSTAGEVPLRDFWKREMAEKNPGLDPGRISHPVVVPGLTNGLSQTADLFVGDGDTVILPDLFWGNYRLIFEERRGASIRTYPLFDENGGFNVDGLRACIEFQPTGSKVILLFNFPNNPSGYSPTRSEAAAIVEIVRETAEKGNDVLAICDDAYFGLFYEDETYKESLFSPLSALHENVLAVKVDGATKEDFVWGFRIGFLTFGSKNLTHEQYEALNKKLMGAIRSSVSNPSRPAQSMLLRAVGGPDYRQEKRERFELLRERYRKVREVLATLDGADGLSVLPFNSGYFMSFSVADGNAERLRSELLHTDGIGTIAIQDSHLRIAYSSVETGDIEALFSSIFSAANRIAKMAARRSAC